MLRLGGLGGQALEHVVGPAQQLGPVLGAHAEGVADHDHRERGGDVADEVGARRARSRRRGSRRTPAAPAARCRAPAAGVKPLFTSLRRCRWSGSSMSIIIGSGPWSGRMPPALENTSVLAGHVLDVGVAGDAPDVAVEVHGRLAAHPGEGLVVVAGPEGAAAEVDVVAGGVVRHGGESGRAQPSGARRRDRTRSMRRRAPPTHRRSWTSRPGGGQRLGARACHG